jgi:hypothetical protein
LPFLEEIEKNNLTGTLAEQTKKVLNHEPPQGFALRNENEKLKNV